MVYLSSKSHIFVAGVCKCFPRCCGNFAASVSERKSLDKGQISYMGQHNISWGWWGDGATASYCKATNASAAVRLHVISKINFY